MYAGGFREMTVGRRLWAPILFLVFRLFFFPDRLAEEYDTDAERARAVARELARRSAPLPYQSPSGN